MFCLDLPRCVPRTRGTAVRRGPGWGSQQGCVPGAGREASPLCLPKSQRYLGQMARLGGCRWESCSWHCFPELLPTEQTPPGQLQVRHSSNICSGAPGVSRVRPCCSWGISPNSKAERDSWRTKGVGAFLLGPTEVIVKALHVLQCEWRW